MLLCADETDRAVGTLLKSEEAYGESEEPRVWALLAKAYAMRGEMDLARKRLAGIHAWKQGRKIINEELLRLEREARAALQTKGG